MRLRDSLITFVSIKYTIGPGLASYPLEIAIFPDLGNLGDNLREASTSQPQQNLLE